MFRMTLDASKNRFDLRRFQNATENDTNFYSTYYLKGWEALKAKKYEELNRFDFQQSFDIDRMKLFPKVVFLGTVSVMASPTRNNTSILLHTT